MPEAKIVVSPFSRCVKRGGEQVDVRIYRRNDTDWILEIVASDGCSTLWEEPFESETAALEEALSAIKDEGIKSFSGSGGVPASAVH